MSSEERRQVLPGPRKHRGRFGQALGFLYYHLDLYGEDGRPSHSKILTTIGFSLTLSAEVWYMVWTSIYGDLADAVNWPFVALVVATLALSMGRDTFKVFLRQRWGGNGSNGSHSVPRPQNPPTERRGEEFV